MSSNAPLRLRAAPPARTAVFLAAALLLWPAVLNGRPFVFTDTDGYQWLGQSAVKAAVAFLKRLAGAPAPLISDDSLFAPDGLQFLSYMGARSPVYGVLLAVTEKVGTVWLSVYLQALAAAWLIWTLMRAAAPGAGVRAYALIVVGLAALTPLPFFAAFVMPDVFAGYAAVAVALLLLYPDRLGRVVRAGLWLLLTVALAVHASHLAAVLVLLVLAVLVAARLGALRPALRRAVPIAGAVAAAVLVGALYPLLVRALPGPAEVNKPPFVMARLLADGPGRAYLAVACRDPNAFEVCLHRDAAMDDSDDILWSTAPGHGVVLSAPPDARLRLKAEEPAFVLGTLRHAPLQVVASGLANVGRQLAQFHVDEPLTPPGHWLHQDNFNAMRALLPGAARCAWGPTACAPPFDAALLRWLHGAVLILATGLAAWRLTRADVRVALSGGALDGSTARLVGLAALLFGFLLINAAVCGGLSGPFPRYQARAVWLAPLVLGLAGAALPRRWPQLPARTPSLDPTLLRFAVVGGGGFLFDAAIAHLLVHGAGLDPIPARLISFSCAVVFTWFFNRRWTFGERRNPRRLREAAAYLAVQSLGAAANIGAYALVLALAPGLKSWLIVPLAVGSAVGLAVNYLGAARLVFVHAPAERT